LVELLIVIAIIALLLALLIPSVQSVRERSRLLQCGNNIKQVALAIHGYENQHGTLPAGSTYQYVKGPVWSAAVLPFLEAQSHYDLFDFTRDLNASQNARAMTTPVRTYLCPSDTTLGDGVMSDRCTHQIPAPQRSTVSSYVGSLGPARSNPWACIFCPNVAPSNTNPCCTGNNVYAGPGIFLRDPNPVSIHLVLDGLSNTIMVGETMPSRSIHLGAFTQNMPLAPTNVPINTPLAAWELPVAGASQSYNHANNPDAKAIGFASLHRQGAQFAFGDGSVRYLTDDIDFPLFNALGSKSGQESVTVP
jgi:type II secretory pathway pseudopilin PulG